MFKKSIRWRLTAVYLFIVAISLFSIGSYLIWRIQDFYLENLKGHMGNDALILAELFSIMREGEGFSPELVDGVCKKIGAKTEFRITFIAEDGKVWGDSYRDIDSMENHLNRPEVQAALEKGTGFSRRYSTTAEMEMLYLATVVEHSAGKDIIRLAVPLSSIEKNIFHLRLILLSGLLAALFIAGLLSWRFSSRLILPLKEFGSVAGSISSGDFDRKVTFQSDDELGSLAGIINEMGRTLKEKVRQISQEKSKLETVISAMTSGVILCDSRGRIDFLNDAAVKLFGVKKEDVIGFSLLAALRNILLSENLQEVLEKGEMRSFELNLFFPETRVLQVYMVPIKGSDGGEIMGALAVFHDITGIRSLERMRSEFVANVSHELRTPLTIIKGYAETLLDENNWQDAQTMKRILTTIDREAERLARLLKDLLNLSQIESSKGVMKKQQINIKQVLAEASGMLQDQAREKNLQLTLHLPEEELQPVRGDADWLLQMFLDVIDNAIKYTPQGGSIDIKVKQKPGEVLIAISDTGIGIPAKNLPYIFERFYRVDKGRSRRLGGTGLGLAIVKHILEAHNGRVEVKSTLGVGTTFFIYLPAVEEQP